MPKQVRSLYITEADPHANSIHLRRRPLAGGALRAYVMMHALFFDRLVVGDSQLINNRLLRSLIWQGEGVLEDIPQDLDFMLKQGYLVPAVRNNADNLTAVWRNLRERRVPEAPVDTRYVTLLEDSLSGQELRYNASEVASLFYRQALSTFDPARPGRWLARSAKQSVHDYIIDQDILYWIGLREWLTGYVSKGNVTERQARAIDDAARTCYRHNLPISLHIAADIPISDSRFWAPVDLRIGTSASPAAQGPLASGQSFELPPFVLSRRFLASLPAQLLPAIKGERSHRSVVKRMAKFEKTGRLDVDRMVDELEEYFRDIDLVLATETPGTVRDEYKRIKRRARVSTRLLVAYEVGLASVALVTGVIDPALGEALGGFGLITTAFGSVAKVREANHLKLLRRGFAIGHLQQEKLLL